MTADADPDAALLRRLAAGEAGAPRAMVTAKLGRILSLARRMLGDSGEAEDVAQEVFTRIWRQAPRWRPGTARFDTWVHLVTLNLCRDRLRRPHAIVMADPPERPDPAPDAEADLLASERAAAVAAAVARLPDRQREAVLLTCYQDLPNAEVATLLGTSVEAVESLLARARRTLRTALVDDGDA
ncbi:RNA polymerase subunit sigma [Sphingomonas sp. Leaf407]|uniref:RNA polymerase sigma factor n=1 Tax=unclassified Sphingomonas TaxID=196159 RepID=UPI0006F3251E|nr:MULTISPECIES: RNA polymerase sigma factor [unclassified Sphingomonas]KQN40267.1 RNA polymerase subunit sigma [Sphingomonas sp. Leaf42]KQT29621.1 RNA polymerase subunit sigma [Sphingomonas sp. Leaf407]